VSFEDELALRKTYLYCDFSHKSFMHLYQLFALSSFGTLIFCHECATSDYFHPQAPPLPTTSSRTIPLCQWSPRIQPHGISSIFHLRYNSPSCFSRLLILSAPSFSSRTSFRLVSQSQATRIIFPRSVSQLSGGQARRSASAATVQLPKPFPKATYLDVQSWISYPLSGLWGSICRGDTDRLGSLIQKYLCFPTMVGIPAQWGVGALVCWILQGYCVDESESIPLVHL